MPFLLLSLLPLSSGKCIMLDSLNIKNLTREKAWAAAKTWKDPPGFVTSVIINLTRPRARPVTSVIGWPAPCICARRLSSTQRMAFMKRPGSAFPARLITLVKSGSEVLVSLWFWWGEPSGSPFSLRPYNPKKINAETQRMQRKTLTLLENGSIYNHSLCGFAP